MIRRSIALAVLSTFIGSQTLGAGSASAEIIAAPVIDTDTVIIPHVFDDYSAGWNNESKDTRIELVLGTDYRGLFPGGSAANLPRSSETVYIYLFLQRGSGKDGLALNDQLKPICNPCTVQLGGASSMRRSVNIQSLIIERNGGTWPNFALGGHVFEGYAVIKARNNLHDVTIKADVLDWSEGGFFPIGHPLTVERMP